MIAEAAATASDSRTAGVAYFDPEDYVINHIRRAVNNKQDVVIDAGPAGRIHVWGTRGQYASDVKEFEEFSTRHSGEFKVTPLRAGDAAAPTGKGARDNGELLWCTAFHASAGRLMEGCYRDDVVELVRWPNLSRLPSTPSTIRMTAFFSRYPTSIILARSLLKVEREELYQFYSAARCAGFARAVNRKAEEPQLEPHRNHTLLSALFGKIIGL